MAEKQQDVADVAKTYYDSHDADQFYYNIWGGEDIHVGLYQGAEDNIGDASHRTVLRMLELLGPLTAQSRVLDIGAGYGGSARVIHQRHGCPVTCLNISEVQNERNRARNAQLGVDDQITVLAGNFESLPFEPAQFDVVWCQDSILHSGKKRTVFQEVDRVLAPGGRFIFTDPMQRHDADLDALKPVLDRIHLAEMGSYQRYRQYAQELGWKEVVVEEHNPQLPNHYGRVRQDLLDRYDDLIKLASQAYVDRMIQGLAHWVEAGQKGQLAWGILCFEKPAA